jgi:regulator of protease activity HflC (stomatin/prohibitin superfamily)
MSLQTLKAEFPKVPAYSMDQQPANLAVSVTWKVDPSRIKEAYADFKGIDGLLVRVINPQTNKQLKSVFGQFTAYRSISERAKFNADFDTALRDSVKEFPVIIESVQIENIDYSAAYEQSVEQRMLAEVEVQKLEQNARREKIQADIRETQADGEARAVVQKAEAEAKAIKLKGDAEAYAIRQRATALSSNPQLVKLVEAERWDGALPQYMMSGGAVPILDMRGR